MTTEMHDRADSQNCLMIGAFTHDNHGDAALVEAMAGMFREASPKIGLCMTSFTPDSDTEYYGFPSIPMIVKPNGLFRKVSNRLCALMPAFLSLRAVIDFVLFGVLAVLIIAWGGLYRLNPGLASKVGWKSFRRNVKAAELADIIVGVPGGYIQAYRWTDTTWLFHVSQILLGFVMGKPVRLAPCTIGPLSGFNERIAARVLSLVETVCLREMTSMKYMESLDLHPSPRYVLAQDSAFFFTNKSRTGVKTSQPVLGVSVRKHNFPGQVSVKAAQKKYFDSVVGAVRGLLQKDPDARVVVVAQTTEDLPISSALVQCLGSERVSMQDGWITPTDLRDGYSHMRLILGTRMHANILAMCGGTPVLPVSYDPKTRGIMRSLGLEDWVLDIDDLGSLRDQLLSRWVSADGERGIIAERVSVAHDQVHQSTQVLLGRPVGL